MKPCYKAYMDIVLNYYTAPTVQLCTRPHIGLTRGCPPSAACVSPPRVACRPRLRSGCCCVYPSPAPMCDDAGRLPPLCRHDSSAPPAPSSASRCPRSTLHRPCHRARAAATVGGSGAAVASATPPPTPRRAGGQSPYLTASMLAITSLITAVAHDLLNALRGHARCYLPWQRTRSRQLPKVLCPRLPCCASLCSVQDSFRGIWQWRLAHRTTPTASPTSS